MSRLLDDIRVGKFGMPWFIAPQHCAEWERHTLKVAEMLDHDIPVLLIPNVAEYIFTGTDQEYWDLTVDFPNLAPPYPQFWSEHHLPTKMRSKECGDTDLSDKVPRGRIGVLVTALDPASQIDARARSEAPPECRWILWTEIFIDFGLTRDYTASGSHGAFFLMVDAQGHALGKPWAQTYSGGRHEREIQSLMSWFHPTFLAMSFMHCKNVAIINNPIDAKLAKRYRERHGRAPTPYKTLVIEPLKQILRTEGRAGEVGLAKAMHICRGHFRDYRQGAGLFGRYHQLVWTPMTVRGTRKRIVRAPEVEVRI